VSPSTITATNLHWSTNLYRYVQHERTRSGPTFLLTHLPTGNIIFVQFEFRVLGPSSRWPIGTFTRCSDGGGCDGVNINVISPMRLSRHRWPGLVRAATSTRLPHCVPLAVAGYERPGTTSSSSINNAGRGRAATVVNQRDCPNAFPWRWLAGW
jgi:hypothetical protein